MILPPQTEFVGKRVIVSIGFGASDPLTSFRGTIVRDDNLGKCMIIQLDKTTPEGRVVVVMGSECRWRLAE